MLTKRYRSFSAALFVTAVILAGLNIQAQQTMTSANLSGFVEDAGGALLGGASVAVKNLNTVPQKSPNNPSFEAKPRTAAPHNMYYRTRRV